MNPYHWIRKLDRDLWEMIRGFLVYASVRGGAVFLSYGSLWMVTHLYGASSVGLLSIGNAVSNLLMFICMFGMPHSAIRHFAELRNTSRKHRATLFRKYFRLTMVVSTFAAVLLILLSSTLEAYWLKSPYTGLTLILFGLAMPFICINRFIVSAFMGVKHIAKSAAMVNVFPPGITLLLLVVAGIAWPHHLMVPVMAQVTAFALTMMVGMWMWQSSQRNLPNDETGPEPGTIREIIHVAFPMMITGSMYMFMRWTDTLVLGAYCTTEDVGIYQVANRVASIPVFVFTAVTSITAPKIAQLRTRSDPERMKQMVWNSTGMIFLLSFPIVAVLSLFPRQILGLFGEEYTGATTVFFLLLITVSTTSLCGLTGPYLNMTGREKSLGLIMFSAAALNLILNLKLIPVHGSAGAAAATCISTVYWNLLTTLYIRKKDGFFMGFRFTLIRIGNRTETSEKK